MLKAILQWIGLGLLMCVLVGPVFFALISVALHYSRRAAIRFAIGTAVSDLIYAGAVYAGVGTFSFSQTAKRWMGVIGGCAFIVMWIAMLHRTRRQERKEVEEAEIHLKYPHPFSFFSQGFITNILNPSVFLFRATAVSASVATLPERSHVAVLIITTLVVFFSTDIIKVHLARKLRRFLQWKALHRLHVLTWASLILIGLFIIIKTLISHHI